MMGRSIAAFQRPDMEDDRVQHEVITDMEGPKVLASLHSLKLPCGIFGELAFEHLFEMLEAFHIVTKNWRRAPFRLVILRKAGQTDQLDAESKKKVMEIINSWFDLEIVWDWERRVRWPSFDDDVELDTAAFLKRTPKSTSSSRIFRSYDNQKYN
ncbi:hypothetical protein NP233_g5350 [Leucocoprinus birnbaumii]|uniref:Uncharacterized protein n=1 Tax=Leucocoprinus birnbaumii TaxID=56174 RepID=A0AAD5YR13_9AGAR|nr:hypothetical protein NP233_g5350 [Leucocoprinus birnbaumii]